LEINMDTNTVSSRRSVLKGLGTIAALAATVAPALAISPAVSPELRTLATAYADAYAKTTAADEAERSAWAAFEKAVKTARLRVPMWGRRGGMRGYFLTIEGATDTAWVRQHIEDYFAERAAKASGAAARQPELAKWIISPEDEIAARDEVRAKAAPILAEHQRLYAASDVAQRGDEAQTAYESFSAVRKALFADRPETMADVRFLARMLWQAAEDSGRWTELPMRDFLTVLCPELGEA
jgi:hypothetical protein